MCGSNFNFDIVGSTEFWLIVKSLSKESLSVQDNIPLNIPSVCQSSKASINLSFGVACILSEHGLDNLFKITDRNYLINDGHIVAEGTKRELLKNSEAATSKANETFPPGS